MTTTGVKVSVNSPLQQRVPNLWGFINSWYYGDDWGGADGGAVNCSAYPFLEYALLMTATGGCYNGVLGCGATRDLLVNNSDPSFGVDATPLLKALRNVVKCGLKPFIVTVSAWSRAWFACSSRDEGGGNEKRERRKTDRCCACPKSTG